MLGTLVETKLTAPTDNAQMTLAPWIGKPLAAITGAQSPRTSPYIYLNCFRTTNLTHFMENMDKRT